MPDRDNIIDALAADENRYIAVRPAGGLRGGYEAVNVWNGDIMRRGEKSELTEWARDKAAWSSSFDYVVEVHAPKKDKGE